MRRLETLLDEWTARAAPNAPRAPLGPAALVVLEEAERRIGDTQLRLDGPPAGPLPEAERPAFEGTLREGLALLERPAAVHSAGAGR